METLAIELRVIPSTCDNLTHPFQANYDEGQGGDEDLKPFTLKHCFLLVPASCCDIIGTSVMYVALTFTSAASFQMLRGAVMIFTGINSMIFLRRRLQWHQWAGMVVVFAGLATVGAADFVAPEPTVR